MAKKVIGYQITNAKQEIPDGLYSFQIFKTAEQAFEYVREHKLKKGIKPEDCWFIQQVREDDIEKPIYIDGEGENIGSEKKKYNVTFYYHTNLTVSVEAKSKEEALALAEAESEKECYTQDLLNGLQEDSSPDVEETFLNDNERFERVGEILAELKRKIDED